MLNTLDTYYRFKVEGQGFIKLLCADFYFSCYYIFTMSNIFKTFFSTDSSISFYSFYKKMVGWRESGVYPFPYNLPSAISFPRDFWKDVFKIYKETDQDGLERAIALFWADGELVLTSVVKGDDQSVKSSHNVMVNYAVHPTKQGYFRREVMIDGKVTKRTDVYHKKAPKKVSVEYLFNMHTHPAQKFNGKKVYSFFSLQDIKSLILSQAVVTGLVTDKLWLLVRTSETPANIKFENFTDADMTVENLTEKFKLGVYEAEFNKKAVKK